MDAADITALIVSLLTAGGLIWDRVTSRRKVKAEAQKTEADADKTGAEANEIIRKTVMDLMGPMQKNIDSLQARVNDLEVENAALKAEAIEAKAERADLIDWADRLVVQVKSFGAKPAEFVRCKREGK